MQHENFSPQESLHLIRETINRAKTSYHDKGIGPILWGCVITVCSLVSFYASLHKISWLFSVWFLTIIAVVPQVMISIKERKEKKFVSFNDNATSAIWITFGFSMFTVSIIDNILNAKYGTGIHASVYMLIYGIPTIITGAICNYRIMLWGGILCWVFAATAAFFKYPYPFLFMAGCAIVAWLIPGLLLYSEYRKQQRLNV
ncbi:MAG: hypothetical protein U0V75_02415 [Ferruginibacter sp.]